MNEYTKNHKPVILTFVGHYLPGFRAGGILRTIVNTVENLSDEFDFRIVTRDRDLGDHQPYADVVSDKWQAIGKSMVYYLSPERLNLRVLEELLTSTKYDILYLNSFFDPLTIEVLFLRKLKKLPSTPVIVAPRGEFAWASLKLKYPKKFVFITIAQLFGLYLKVRWHSSSEYESEDIIKIMKVNPSQIHIALDLPSRILPEKFSESAKSVFDPNLLKIVFLSRISREKNLDFAIKVLNGVRVNVTFDIFGPAEDIKYWDECKGLIKTLPNNIKVNYLGIVNPLDVINIFRQYDLFLFPSGGENYGHVIAESLISGTPVLISDKTPWRDLQKENLGWDISLDRIDSFTEVIELYASLNISDRLKKRKSIMEKIEMRLFSSGVMEANKSLFLNEIQYSINKFVS